MYFHGLFELTEKLALEVGLPVPVSNQSKPVSSVHQEHLSAKNSCLGIGSSPNLVTERKEQRTLKSKNTVLERSQNTNLSDAMLFIPRQENARSRNEGQFSNGEDARLGLWLRASTSSTDFCWML